MNRKRSFKQYVMLKEEKGSKDWKQESAAPPLDKGFIPPQKLRPVIRAFLNSGSIVLQKDTSTGKDVAMPKKTLYLVGGPVRDFIKGKTVHDYDLATNATPAQTATILSAAGFKKTGDKSGKDGEELNLPAQFYDEDGQKRKIEDAEKGDTKRWFIKGRDNSEIRKVFVISAVVEGEEFEIATFRKDAKVVDGQAEVDFTDNPKEDAERRDLTINSLYIELTKADGENKKLYDPTGSGLHDLKHSVVKTVGKAQERFDEDPLRIMRAIRFHCRFGQGDKLDPEIAKAIPNFMNLPERVALERIRDEFLKGLLHPDVDSKKYLTIYNKTKLLQVIFPGVNFAQNKGVPAEFSDKSDKPLALAWLLRYNPVETVGKLLSPMRQVGAEQKATGWQVEERRAVLFLLKLKNFQPDQVSQFTRGKMGTGLSPQQIRDWVEMFNAPGTKRNTRGGWWKKRVNAFADHQPSVKWDDVVASGGDTCKNCRGMGCEVCQGSGKVPPQERGKIISSLEAEAFKKKLG